MRNHSIVLLEILDYLYLMISVYGHYGYFDLCWEGVEPNSKIFFVHTLVWSGAKRFAPHLEQA